MINDDQKNDARAKCHTDTDAMLLEIVFRLDSIADSLRQIASVQDPLGTYRPR